MNDPVTAAGFQAVAEASVFLHRVAIIAGFPCVQNPVTATGENTGIETFVCLGTVAIVTGFPCVQNPIATTRRRAVDCAVVLIIVIAIVTGFKTSLTQDPVSPGQTVTAAGIKTTVCAGISVFNIPIIAGFVAQVFGS